MTFPRINSFVFLGCAPTFVFQPESSCRDADIGEEVEVELVGGAVEECRDGGALGRGLTVGVEEMLS